MSESGKRCGNTTASLRKWLQWIKWLGGTTIAIFVAGFSVAQYMEAFATVDSVQAQFKQLAQEEKQIHTHFRKDVDKIEDKVSEINENQIRVYERMNVMNKRLEILVERTERARSQIEKQHSEKRIRELKRKIKELESDLPE